MDMNSAQQLSTTAIAGWLMYAFDVLDKPAARTYVASFLALVVPLRPVRIHVFQ